MRTSNKSDAQSISKLAILACAGATAAFVISQARLMRRLAETSAPAAPEAEPEVRPAASAIETQEAPASDRAAGEAPGPPAENELPPVSDTGTDSEDEAAAPSSEDESLPVSDTTDEEAAPSTEDEGPPVSDTTVEEAATSFEDEGPPVSDTTVEEAATSFEDEDPPVSDTTVEEAATSFEDEGPPSGTTDGAPTLPEGGERPRVPETPEERERRRYGLPPLPRPQATAAAEKAPVASSVAVLEAPAPSTPVFDGEDFDAGYLALVAAIANDGHLDDDEPEAPADAPSALRTPDAVDDMWWLPAPRLQYIIVALAYIATAAFLGTDPVALAARGVSALTTVNSTAEFIVLGWILCGLVVIVPLGTLAARTVSLITLGRLRRPAAISGETVESASWGLRLLATSAFIAGAILYTPYALSWALNTDYPIAAVSSSSMSPSLQEGELVLIDGVDSMDDLRLGDIIAFSHDGGIAVRRITGFGDGEVMARADAGPDEDFVIPFSRVAGRVLTLAGAQVKLPLLGNISLLGERTVDPETTFSGLP